METRPLGNTQLCVPRMVYGTSCLGNLYEALPDDTKLAICRAWFEAIDARPVVIDSAGKYGAGLALEVIGNCLRTLDIQPDDIVISNKLGWLRVPLEGDEPTFEPGAWADLEHDAVQRISYSGILECWQQGCELLGDPYRPQLVSVHDPDEYLAAAADEQDRQQRLADVFEAYRALQELKDAGEVQAIGIGAKDWRVIQQVAQQVDLDWVMLAGSLTVYRHPPEILQFIEQLSARGVGIINSAVFQAGFLVGGTYLDYRVATPESDPEAFAWRERFLKLCTDHGVSPATVCIQFGLGAPGVAAIALNTGHPDRVFKNAENVNAEIPDSFWRQAKVLGLIAGDFPIGK